MQNVSIGECIRQRRKELNLTQEDLCFGICETSTLSRIENGHHAPCRSKINALLQRLGLPEERYYALVSENEKQIEGLKKEIVACNVASQCKRGRELLNQLENLIEPDDMLSKQFIMRSRVLLGKLDNLYTQSEQIEILLKAIRLTVPSFELNTISEHLYTFDEIKIINQLANIYVSSGGLELALNIYAQLTEYIENHYQEVITGNGLLPLILHNYARAFNLASEYGKCIETAEKGRITCIRYGHYQFLPGFVALKAEAYYFLGDKSKSLDFYTQAYYIYKATDNYKALSAVRLDAKKYLNIELPD